MSRYKKQRVVTLKPKCSCGAIVALDITERDARRILRAVRGKKSKAIEIHYRTIMPGEKGYNE